MSNLSILPQKPEGDILLYQSDNGQLKIQVRLEKDTVWLSQADMVELFQSSKSSISEHIKHVFAEGELVEEVVVRNFRTTAKHGAIAGKTIVSAKFKRELIPNKTLRNPTKHGANSAQRTFTK